MNAIFNLQSFCFQIKIYMAMANFIGGGGCIPSGQIPQEIRRPVEGGVQILGGLNTYGTLEC
jgi:hypothetical protein